MEKHFVTFFSPGTFMSEASSQPIDSWDIEEAKRRAMSVSERYGATPYGFRFSTRTRTDLDLDSNESASSPIYYLGGVVRTANEILSGTDPDESVLRSNVRCNDFKRIITNTNSWRFTGPLNDDDVVLDYAPPAPQSPPQRFGDGTKEGTGE